MSSTVPCSAPFWSHAHLSSCAQDRYLSNIIPIAFTLFSALLLLSVSIYFWIVASSKHGFQPLANIDEDQDHFSASECANPIGCSPRISPLVASGEAILLVADIALGLSVLITSHAPENFPALGSTTLSIYLLVLLLIRQVSNNALQSRLALQKHSVWLYVLQWCCGLPLVHAGVVDASWTTLNRNATITRFILYSLLITVHLTAPQVSDQRLDECVVRPSKSETASLFSSWTFYWIESLLWRAYKGQLRRSDIYELRGGLTANSVIADFHANQASSASLLRKLFVYFLPDILHQGAWATLTSITVFVPPHIIRLILNFIQSPENENKQYIATAWICIFGLLISGVVTALSDCQAEWIGKNMVVKMRAILIGEIYSKVLRRKVSVGSQVTDGNIVNLMSADAETAAQMTGMLHLSWVYFPVQLTIAIWLLYHILGISGIIGVVLMICLLPFNVFVSKGMMRAQENVLKAADERIQSSNEVLHNIRTIKYCAWEYPFRERVMSKRRAELKFQRTGYIWWSLSMTVFYSLPLIVTILTCFFYTVVFKNELGTATAFPALAVFSVVRIPLDRMADSISYLLQAHVSLVRVADFLAKDENSKLYQLRRCPGATNSTVGFKDATLFWPPKETKNPSESSNEETSAPAFNLHNLSIAFQEGGLSVVSGPSGSGKTSLLLSLLGEMDLASGQVCLPHQAQQDLNEYISMYRNLESFALVNTTAYCSQEPWILNRSIRANILLGMPLAAERYAEVIKAVALEKDLAELEQSDGTIAGENGSRLSGGQKQRVALARALYSLSKYVILDDCLSALDHSTANRIFFQAIKGPLMEGRTCILATHHTKLAMPYADLVVLLDDGQIKAQGKPDDLASKGVISIVPETGKLPTSAIIQTEPLQTRASYVGLSLETADISTDLADESNIEFREQEDRTDYEESTAEGAVSWSVILSYVNTMGGSAFWIIVLVGFVAQQVASLGTNLWIKRWAYQYDEAAKKQLSGDNDDNVNAAYYLGVYVAICLLCAMVTFLRDGITFYGALRASSRIYQGLLDSILHARLLFFDRTPIGQMINRFSQDVRVMDGAIASFSVSLLQLVVTLIMTIVVVSVVLPSFLFLTIFIVAAYYAVSVIYLGASRDLKRIESIERSPLYQQLGETVSGCVSIRASAYEGMFINMNNRLVDKLNMPIYLQWATKEWMTFRIGVLSSLIQFSTGAFVLWHMKSIEPGAAGLALTYAATFTETALFLVQLWAIVQQNFNSVERIKEYTEIDQEPKQALKNPDRPITDEWPDRGAIVISDYATKYSPELDRALNAISFKVDAGQRVAIVGRTGSGKSTLALSLIRGLEADNGSITIDGVDIASTTLHRLRSAVTVVPQDPILFDGSIRDNLDPLREHADTQILAILRDIQFTIQESSTLTEDASPSAPSTSSTTPQVNLDHSASSFSRGQKQLLCIARGLLRKSRVLVLDEATASIDHQTDEKIQACLKASLQKGTTVLTIAHRLLTIADYHHVVVLDSGRVVEQGSVAELLDRQTENSVFRRLCEESGDFDKIKRLAASLSLI
ncbi:Hypothetical protein R9X50_00445800 [Acrodontium crateriforme]|uniref:Uncharacterized protein n=1 Tax=Acrodontium crateriforme TaxID=150365 RepID=A0AAQ3M687_9PEZI|nr:Hypothetical protein R9X50_00445800 [Acrodontium crateriforme]